MGATDWMTGGHRHARVGRRRIGRGGPCDDPGCAGWPWVRCSPRSRATAAPDWALRLVADGLAGLALFGYNIGDTDQVAALTAALRAARPDVLIAIDEEGGDVTRLAHATGSPYPGNAALGVVDDAGADPADLPRDRRRAGGGRHQPRPGPHRRRQHRRRQPDHRHPQSFGADPARVAAHAAAAVTGPAGGRRRRLRQALPRARRHRRRLAPANCPPWTRRWSCCASATCRRSRRRSPPASKAMMTAHIRVPALTGDGPATFSRAVAGRPAARRAAASPARSSPTRWR